MSEITPSEAAAALGRIKSAAKAKQSAENGKSGGRPKGTPQSEETKAKIRIAWARRRQQAEGQGGER